MSTFLDAPCTFCGYNGPGYYQEGTHAESCPWNQIGGRYYREMELSSVLRARIAELEGKLEEQRAAAEYATQYTMTVWSEEEGREISFRDSEVDRRLNAAFANPSPTAQALARLVEAAAELRQLWTGNENVWSKARTADAWGRFVRAVDAYQAARSGRGRGK